MRMLGSIILSLTLILPGSAFAQPSIVFEEIAHDFGEVEQNEQLKHAFEFRNEGTEDLVIEQLRPS